MKTSHFVLALMFAGFGPLAARADSTAQTLPFAQDWSNAGLITADDNWSGVPGFVGYRGDNLTLANDVNPATVLTDGTDTPVEVIANQNNANTLGTGGVAEFLISDNVVAVQGSSTADAPFLLLNLNTLGQQNITLSYNLRDIDGSLDNSVQAVALHYRVGNTGDFTNVAAAFVADASSGPSLATLITPIIVTLPAALNHQPLVQIRWMTANATGNDEWIGIDDIGVTGDPYTPPPGRYSITKHVVAGGGGTSSGIKYSVNGTVGQPEARGTMASARYSAAGGFWAFPTVVEVSGAPTLTISLTDTNTALISWPFPSTGFLLEQNSDANSANWTTAPETITDSGGTRFIIAIPTPGNRFYRLVKP